MNAETKTTAGEVRGAVEDDMVVFRGIPFAAPPIGDRRWQAPQPPEPWSGVRQALSFGPACPQETHELAPATMQVTDRQEEDCLYLNIWTPGLQGKRPVMVWITGGGFNIGAGSLAVNDGQHIARRGDVVVVTINYRLGPLGFVHLAQITKGSIPATGNEGLLDQVAALRWVRDNISAFGGDPDNVTIFGESAGGMSVSSLLAMPSARGLFHKAIPQSGAPTLIYTVEQATRLIAKPMIGALGVEPTDAKALRSATPAQLMEACPSFMQVFAGQDVGNQQVAYPRTVIDGTVLPCYPVEAVASGAAKGIPILMGTTRDEMSYYLDVDPTMNDANLVERLELAAPGLPYERLVEVYREARQKRLARVDAGAIYSTIQSHRMFWIPTVRLLDAQRVHGPVYQYIFEWTAPDGDGRFGARHGTDIGFTFGTHDLNDACASRFGSGPAADALSGAFIDAWVAFARVGDPSTDSLGKWRPYGEDCATMLIGERTRLVEAPYEEERRAWDGVPNERLVF